MSELVEKAEAGVNTLSTFVKTEVQAVKGSSIWSKIWAFLKSVGATIASFFRSITRTEWLLIAGFVVLFWWATPRKYEAPVAFAAPISCAAPVQHLKKPIKHRVYTQPK